jgi:hypothetical protein
MAWCHDIEKTHVSGEKNNKSSMCGFLLLLAINEFGIIVTKNNS